jgi:MOSC domain-containing protein YiiM
MKIISTNIGQSTTIIRNGNKIKTGFFKTSVKGPLSLGLTDVVGDVVINRKHHGGIDKACYLYSADHYDYWKEKFPKLIWDWGMFGENLTIEGLNEAKIKIGDTFKVGTAIIQVSQPRRPCTTLGLKFGTQDMINLFNNSPYPGVYVRIIKEGKVKVGDALELIKTTSDNPSVEDIFSLFSTNNKNLDLAKKAILSSFLAKSCIKSIKTHFQL